MVMRPQDLEAEARKILAPKLLEVALTIDEKLKNAVAAFGYTSGSTVEIFVDHSYTQGMLFQEIKRMYGEVGWVVTAHNGGDQREQETWSSLKFKTPKPRYVDYDGPNGK